MSARIIGWDNFKGFLICLVVFGHFLEIFIGTTGLIRNIWMLIYCMHMPAFAFVSGYFFKNKPKFYLKYGLIYIVFQIFYIWYAGAYSDEKWPYEMTWHNFFLRPCHHLWYIFSLLVWGTVAAVCRKITLPVLLLSVTVAIAVPYSHILSIWLKSIYFLPYFMLGLYLRRINFNLQDFLTRYHRLINGAFIGGALLMLLLFDLQKFHYQWLLGICQYTGFYTPTDQIFLIALATAGTLSAAQLIYARPRKFLTWCCRYTLYIYLLHMMLILPFRA